MNFGRALVLFVGFYLLAVLGHAREYDATLAVVNPVLRSPLAKTLSLDGDWDFVTDPSRKGMRARWFFPDVKWPKANTIRVPACWEAQGYAHTGVAWYRKKVEIPVEWEGQQVWLKIGGVNVEGWVWANAVLLGKLNKYCGSVKYDVSDIATPGGNLSIVVMVRNDVKSLTNQTTFFGVYGGLHRSVELEATSARLIDDAYTVPVLDEGKVEVHVTLRNVGAEAATGEYALRVTAQTIGEKPQSAGRARVPIAFGGEETLDVVIDLPLEPCLPWSPGNPQLYRADIVLEKDGQPIHGWTERFGVRKWEVRGQQFYLNNKPFYMRAFGDDWTYPVHLAAPASVEFHKKNLQQAKDFGFNYVRHHTHTEIPEFYEAADEVGIMIQAEFNPQGYGNIHFDQAQTDEMKTVFTDMITQLRRYVSLSTYCVGNESWLMPPTDTEIYQFIKKADPTRLVLHMDGGNNMPGNSDFTTSWGDKDFGEPWAFSYMDYNRADTNAGSVDSMPHILHEYLNIAAEQDPRLEPQWTGAKQSPVSLDDFKADLTDAGLSYEWGERILEAGYTMQRDIQKRGVENARIVPWLDGYCFWTIVDFYTMSSQGLFDPFWGVKASTREFVRQFNGPVAIMASGIPERPIFGREPFDAAKIKRPGVFIIAGQSNASGHQARLADKEESDPRVTLFGNDYVWKTAYEPTDDSTGQLDKVSSDYGYVGDGTGHSFALRAAKDLLSAGVKSVKLIPCAKGGSAIAEWRNTGDPFDRNTLFGSCNYRRSVAAPDGVTAMWWHQGESQAERSLEQYIADQTGLVGEFRGEMGADLPIIYAQLAKNGSDAPPVQHHIAEAQRRLETGSGSDCALRRFHMVVTFDLPLTDMWHLTQEGQKELGRRVALATRQHVYGEDVDGTGPRLVRTYHPEGRLDQIKVVFNQPINKGADNYEGQFRVFNRSQKTPYDPQAWRESYDYAYRIADPGDEIQVAKAVRDPGDENAVLITLAEKATDLVRISYGQVAPPGLRHWHSNVVKGANELPAPSFGPLAVGEELAPTHDGLIHVDWVVSNMGGEPIERGKLKWKLMDGKKKLASGRASLDIEAGLCQRVAKTAIKIPAVKTAVKAELVVEVRGTDIANRWPIWIMPEIKADADDPLDGVSATATVYDAISGRYPALALMGIDDAAMASILVTDDVLAALDALEQGGRVLLLGNLGSGAIEATPDMGWWVKNNQTGTAIAQHAAFGDFVHDGYLTPLLFRMIDKADQIKKSYRAAEPLMAGNGRDGYHLYAFQAHVGESGKLLATSLNLLSGAPESQYLLDQFIRYVSSDQFAPTGYLDLDEVRITSSAPPSLVLAKQARKLREANRIGEADEVMKEALSGMSAVELIDVAHIFFDAGYAPEARRVVEALLPAATTTDIVRDAVALSRKLDMPPAYARRLGLVTNWWLAGPFPWDQNMGLRMHQVKAANVDLNETYSPYGTEIRWKTHKTTDKAGLVDLVPVFGELVDATAYGLAEIIVPEATEAELRIGSDDAVKAWVNGKEVHEMIAFRPVVMDNDRVPITLKAGKNRILLNIAQATGDWGFCVRITKRDGSPLPFTMEAGETAD